MRFKYRILLPFLFFGAMAGSIFTSCEKECVECGCSSLAVEKFVSSDSMDVALQQLQPNSTIVVLGSGLSIVNKAYLMGYNSIGQDTIYPIELNPAYVADGSIIFTLSKERAKKGYTYETNRLVLEATGCKDPYVFNILKPALEY
jgi:hypothetical protein